MEIELRHLRVVCAIAEAGSVTKAAAALGLAQPALTTQLQRIERALGGALFERDRRGARPTPLGELVLARARVLIPAVKGLQDDAAQLAGAGTVMSRYRVGATNGPIIGGLVHRLSVAHPQKHVSTYATWSADEIAEMVVAGRLDYALIGACADSTPSAHYGLTWRPVCVDAVCVLLSDRHPLAQLAEVQLADLAAEEWANAPGDGCFSDCFAAACARAGFTPRHIYEMDVGGCIDLVVSGAAVVLCQGMFRPVPGVAMVPIAGTPLRWRHLLGWHPDSVAADGAEEVLALAVAAYQEVLGQRPAYASWLRDHPRFGQTVNVQLST
jgi:DNA-binding transcriptional LysR family regulator